MSDTCISALKIPVSTGTPSDWMAAMKSVMSGSATSGAAADTKDGLKPLWMLPYNVNWETTSTEPLMDLTDKFI